jgi:hypothetical protein
VTQEREKCEAKQEKTNRPRAANVVRVMTGDPTPDTPPDTPKPKPGLRDAQGRILPGSGKSGGRKVGSKNKPSPIEGMLLGKEPELAKALVHWVEQGNSAAITVVFRYLLPQSRARPLSVDLPRINSAAELPEAINVILAAMHNGRVTMAEGATAIGAYDTLAKAYSIADFERRIQALEKGGGNSDAD